jgi:tetratricopeptide (TPR) repeat protein
LTNEQIEGAMRYAYNGNWAASVLAWDEILRTAPDYAPGYYWRGKSYFNMTFDQRYLDEYGEYVRLGLQDADRAIQLDADTGDYYFLRAQLYVSLAAMEDFRSTYELYSRVASENTKRALAAGVSDPAASVVLPAQLLAAGRCQESLAEARRQLAALRPSDPPRATFLTGIANAHLCLGNYTQALTYIDQALAVSENRDRRFLRAEILYGLGRLPESLAALDALISARPDYSGRRYYIRALVRYDMGEPELAQADLEMGYRNTWGQFADAALLRGLLARDAGDTQLAIEELQMAEATIPAYAHPSLQRARSELARLRAQPMDQGIQFLVEPTSMPTPTPGTDSQPIITAPAATQVDYSMGAGELDLAPGGYLTFRFSDPTPRDVSGADWLTIWVLPVSAVPIEGLDIVVWMPSDNLWTVFHYKDDLIEPGDPGRFVLPSGDVIIAAYAGTERVRLSGIMVSAGPVLADGSKVTLGTRPVRQ